MYPLLITDLPGDVKDLCENIGYPESLRLIEVGSSKIVSGTSLEGFINEACGEYAKSHILQRNLRTLDWPKSFGLRAPNALARAGYPTVKDVIGLYEEARTDKKVYVKQFGPKLAEMVRQVFEEQLGVELPEDAKFK